MPLPFTISCSSKSRLVLPFPDKGLLNGCSSRVEVVVVVRFIHTRCGTARVLFSCLTLLDGWQEGLFGERKCIQLWITITIISKGSFLEDPSKPGATLKKKAEIMHACLCACVRACGHIIYLADISIFSQSLYANITEQSNLSKKWLKSNIWPTRFCFVKTKPIIS